ncbi:MAG: NAD-dependent epimerase/dehydratase family protein [Burkholderiales bacterium]
MKTILMTGAAGSIGTFLRKELADRYRLRLSDIRTIADLRGNESFMPGECASLDDMLRVTEGVAGIIHLGGFSVEGPWDAILHSNIIGTYNLYEAARRNGVKRVIFATSNHAIGFFKRTDRIDHTVYPKPDGRYGLSKMFGEGVASLYADKYGVSSLCIRIGNVAMQPVDVRRLSIWISPRDLAQLMEIGLDHPDIRFEIVYGASDNARGWWDNTNAHRLGYRPRDRSEDFAADVLRLHPSTTGDPIADAHQGGSFCTSEKGGDPFKTADGRPIGTR